LLATNIFWETARVMTYLQHRIAIFATLFEQLQQATIFLIGSFTVFDYKYDKYGQSAE